MNKLLGQQRLTPEIHDFIQRFNCQNRRANMQKVCDWPQCPVCRDKRKVAHEDALKRFVDARRKTFDAVFRNYEPKTSGPFDPHFAGDSRETTQPLPQNLALAAEPKHEPLGDWLALNRRAARG